MLYLANWLDDKKSIANIIRSKERIDLHIDNLCSSLSKSSRSNIIFLDNIDKYIDAKKNIINDDNIYNLIESLIYCEHNCNIIITSRTNFTMFGQAEFNRKGNIEVVLVGDLSVNDSVELLIKRGMSKHNQNKLREISNKVNGNPLLLNLIPPILNKEGGKIFLHNLDDLKRAYREELFKDKLIEDVIKEWREHLIYLSYVMEPLIIDDIKILWANDEKTYEFVDELVDRCLLEKETFGKRNRQRYYLQTTLAEVVREEYAEDKEKMQDVKRRSADMYLARKSCKKPQDKWRSLADCKDILKAINLLIDIGELTDASDLFLKIPHQFMIRTEEFSMLEEYYSNIIKIRKKRFDNKFLLKTVVVRGNLGLIYLRKEDPISKENYAKALENLKIFYKKALKIKDYDKIGRALCHLGIVYYILKDINKSLNHFNMLLRLADKVINRDEIS